MGGTYSADRLAVAVGTGLGVCSGQYRVVRGGLLQFDGDRPAVGWHAHGYFTVGLGVVRGREFAVVRVRKRRWLEVGEGRTCHSRPPDALVSCRFSATVVVLVLWALLDGDAGQERFEDPVAELEHAVSTRTVRRWLARAVSHGMVVQQAARAAVIERCEPRPVEQWFPGGLPPPIGLQRRRWANPRGVAELWRGFAFVFGGCLQADVPVPRLLAEARGRCSPQTDSFPI